MELVKVNNRYWIDGKEVEASDYNNALKDMDDQFVRFIESDFMALPEDKFTEESYLTSSDTESPIGRKLEDAEREDEEECYIVESLLQENSELHKENEALRTVLESYENSNFDVELAFNQLYDRLDKIEFMINHLQIPVSYYNTTFPNIDPNFWKVTCGSCEHCASSTADVDEPCALATDPEAPKKRTRKLKNER